MNGNFEEFKTEVTTLRNELKEAKHLILECQKKNRTLSKELDESYQELIQLKQYSRRSNLEVKGIAVTENEDIPKVVEAIASRSSARLSSHDIEIAHRVPKKAKGPPNIVIQFASRTTRDRFLSAATKTRLNALMLGFQGADLIFVNEQLCPADMILLRKAIATKRAKGWKFAWVSDGKILIRKA